MNTKLYKRIVYYGDGHGPTTFKEEAKSLSDALEREIEYVMKYSRLARRMAVIEIREKD